MAAAIARMAARIHVSTVIDVGASDGRWSVEASRHFPGAEFLLVEANRRAHGAALEALTSRRKEFHAVLAAAGDLEGEASFDGSDPFGGRVIGGLVSRRGDRVHMVTLDAEVERLRLPPPYLVKLDTHGFEVPILDGAKRVLESTSLVIIEVYNFDLGGGALRFDAQCRDMERRGFRPADVADPMWRRHDRFLWQMDLFFVPSSRAEFARNSYE